MENQNICLKKNDAKYSYGNCSDQVLQKKSLLEHKKIVHKEVKYSCRQCDYQAI